MLMAMNSIAVEAEIRNPCGTAQHSRVRTTVARGIECFWCGRLPRVARRVCACGAEYLNDGWWWLPNGEECT